MKNLTVSTREPNPFFALNINHYIAPYTEIYSLFLSILGMVSAFYLWFDRKSDENLHLNRLLALILSMSSFHFFRNYLIASQWIIEFPLFFGSFSFIYLLAPGVTYIYIRGLLNDETASKRSDWPHFILPALQFISSFPYIISSHENKVAYVKGMSQMNHLLTNQNPYNGISYVFMYFLVLAVVVFYGVLMFRELQKKKLHDRNTHFNHIYSWARWVTWIMLLMALSMLINVFVSSYNLANTVNFIYMGPFYAVRLLLFSILLYRILFSSRIRLGLPNLNNNRSVLESALAQKDVRNESATGTQSINNTTTTDLFNELSHTIFSTRHELYTHHDFNLDSLSQATDIPRHHWAYYFRYHASMSFVETRNYHRVQYAKKLIADPEYANITLEAIGHEAGFGSRTTFFNAFKKFEKLSPSDYLKNLIHSTGSAKI